MSRNLEPSKLLNTVGFSRYSPLQLDFEHQILITSNTTFVVPPNAKAVKFTAVGGGQAGVGTTGGPGAGYFEKTFYPPFTGLATSFQLTIGAANGGNTILRDSAGNTIATAFGATAIGPANPVGVGGTASGGDINTQGSPGGITPGVGGASGGVFGDSVYNPTYAGRWIYFRESIVNDNVRNYFINNIELTRGTRVATIGVNSLGAVTAQYGALINPSGPGANVAGIFANGTNPGGLGGFGGNGGIGAGPGGYGGNGGAAPYPGGAGGAGGYGGSGAPGRTPYSTSAPGQPGGAGGFAGAGGAASNGRGGPSGVPYPPGFYAGASGGPGGTGGPTGFGGGGGAGGDGGPGGNGGPRTSGPLGPLGGSGGNGGNGGPGGPGGFGGGGGRGGNLGNRGLGGPGGPLPPFFPYQGPTSGAPGTPGSFGVVGTPGNGGAGAVYIEWTMKEPSKLGV